MHFRGFHGRESGGVGGGASGDSNVEVGRWRRCELRACGGRSARCGVATDESVEIGFFANGHTVNGYMYPRDGIPTRYQTHFSERSRSARNHWSKSDTVGIPSVGDTPPFTVIFGTCVLYYHGTCMFGP